MLIAGKGREGRWREEGRGREEGGGERWEGERGGRGSGASGGAPRLVESIYITLLFVSLNRAPPWRLNPGSKKRRETLVTRC